jgi:hypothetical protein
MTNCKGSLTTLFAVPMAVNWVLKVGSRIFQTSELVRLWWYRSALCMVAGL